MCDEEGNEWVDKKTYNSLYEEYEKANNIIKEVREYIENNWISKKDADIYRFDNEELGIEIRDIAVILEILDKVGDEKQKFGKT